MNKYVRKLFGAAFQSQQTQQIVHIQAQHVPTSPEGWQQYWQAKGFPWRTEPEIDEKRQEELSKCRAIVPDIEKGIYPFKGMKLSRADLEWLLATHENGRGPVNWSNQQEREREGLDLRGADLRQADLRNLPLTRLRGGLTREEWRKAMEKQRVMAAVCMEKADLTHTQLQGASLLGAQLQRADLTHAQLERAGLRKARLDGANLFEAQLERANLSRAQLEMASLRRTQLKRADLHGAQLQGADLRSIVFGTEEYIGPIIVDVRWGDANLAVVDWSQVTMLGDEYEARQKRDASGDLKGKVQSLKDDQAAVRANRQLAVALQDQGLNEDATRFAYRAQVLQRKLLWKQREIGRWLFSLLLALLIGYGYRIWRILAAYMFIVSLCAVAYFVVGIYHPPHLTLLQAFLESITAFHGRVFFELFTPDTPQIWVTAFEAVAGLVIEGVFIAMLTQRFFGK